MAGKVFYSVTMSLDGFMAPESLGDLMGRQWVELQRWVFPQRFFRESLQLGGGGEEGRDNDILRETHRRTGASVMGKRMFDAGEQAWPEEAPFHTPVFVLTHEKRDLCFFQAEDGIRDESVTGVQTCALPISYVPGRCATTCGESVTSEPTIRTY